MPKPTTGNALESPRSLDRWERILGYLYVAAAAFPLFLYPGYRASNLNLIFDPKSPMWQDSQSLRVHAVILVTPLIVAIFVLRVLRRYGTSPAHGGWLIGLVASFLIALSAGLLQEPGWLNGVFFVQTVLPVFGYLVGSTLARSTTTLRQAHVVFVTSNSLALVGILLMAYTYDVFSGDIVAANRLARAVPQIRDYFPFVVATSLALTLGLAQHQKRWTGRVLLAGAITLQLAFFVINWSRMGLLMLALVILVSALLRPALGNGRYKKTLMALGLILAMIGIVALSSVMVARWKRGEFGPSDSRRFQYAATAVEKTLSTPLGRMFIPDWERDPFPDRQLRVRRMYKAHNQYLDYGVRAGLPAIALLGILLWLVLRDLYTALVVTVGQPSRSLTVGVAAALAACVVGCMTQLLLVQAQSGAVSWLLLGSAAGIARRLRAGAVSDRPDPS